jgi:hypothetical protein
MKTAFSMLFSVALALSQVVFALGTTASGACQPKASCACSHCATPACCAPGRTPAPQPASAPSTRHEAPLPQFVLVPASIVVAEPPFIPGAGIVATGVFSRAGDVVPIFQRNCVFLI